MIIDTVNKFADILGIAQVNHLSIVMSLDQDFNFTARYLDFYLCH